MDELFEVIRKAIPENEMAKGIRNPFKALETIEAEVARLTDPAMKCRECPFNLTMEYYDAEGSAQNTGVCLAPNQDVDTASERERNKAIAERDAYRDLCVEMVEALDGMLEQYQTAHSRCECCGAEEQEPCAVDCVHGKARATLARALLKEVQ